MPLARSGPLIRSRRQVTEKQTISGHQIETSAVELDLPETSLKNVSEAGDEKNTLNVQVSNIGEGIATLSSTSLDELNSTFSNTSSGEPDTTLTNISFDELNIMFSNFSLEKENTTFISRADVNPQTTTFSSQWESTKYNSTLPKTEPNNSNFTTENTNWTSYSPSAPPSPVSPSRAALIAMNWYMTLIINPVIGALGILGNIVNCLILNRDGLDKPSNIFLFALAIADVCTLVDSLDVATILSQLPKSIPLGSSFIEYDCHRKWQGEIILNINRVIIGLFTFGVNITSTLCVVITIERLVAIFSPLKFKTLITCTRAWLVVATVSAVYFAQTVILMRKLYFVFGFSSKYQVCLCGSVVRYDDFEMFLDMAVTWIGCGVSLAIITVGSCVILVKIKLIQRNRRHMTSSASSSTSRTTRTLMSVCGVFVVTQVIRFPYAISSQPFEDIYVNLMYTMVVMTTSYINSAVNFVIYVTLNSKFRKIFVAMVGCRKDKKSLKGSNSQG
ncbi:FMRFamide receptor-like [Physella acuta]|uniref:FMRFamide receptor-like n=1 Tax=Physella acuta TaxID=109671 RepID=UPI0027DE0A83|nr:FMRFamide receptor-like [Physella acuta]